MNILHLLAAGGEGGIEVLNKEIYLRSKHNNIYCFLYAEGGTADEMKKEGAKSLCLSSANILSKIINVIKYVKNNNIEVVITHHAAPLSWLLATILKSLYNINVFIYIHGSMRDVFQIGYGKNIFVKKIIFNLAAKKAKGIIAISDYVGETIKAYSRRLNDKIKVICNGTDINKFTYSDEKHEKFTVEYVGRLFSKKGVDVLIDALSKLDVEYLCYIVGGGDEYDNLLNRVKELNLCDKIKLVGSQNNVKEWHQKADVFVHPAVWDEGFGIAVIEAMASGLPCIAFCKGALPEIITDGKNGFLAEDTNCDSLAERISYAYNLKNNNLDEWNKMKHNARKRAEDFTIEKMVNKLDEFIES